MGTPSFFKGAVLAKTRARYLHELVDLDRLATTMGTQGQAKRRRAFALCRRWC